MKYTLSQWRWYRRLKGGRWYFVRPYDNLYDFSWMRYWIKREPIYNEVVMDIEVN